MIMDDHASNEGCYLVEKSPDFMVVTDKMNRFLSFCGHKIGQLPTLVGN